MNVYDVNWNRMNLNGGDGVVERDRVREIGVARSGVGGRCSVELERTNVSVQNQ